MTMTGRTVDHGIRVLAAVALFCALWSSPIRTVAASSNAHRGDRHPRVFGILHAKPGRQSSISARPTLSESGSLQAVFEERLEIDDEDKATVSIQPTSFGFEVISLPRPELYFAPIGGAVALAIRPLRC